MNKRKAGTRTARDSGRCEKGTELELNYAEMGRRIRESRKQRGMTVEALSEQVGLAAESLRHIETAASYPSLLALYRIASALEVSMDYITGRTATLTDTLVREHSLSTGQETVLREVINSILPMITR